MDDRKDLVEVNLNTIVDSKIPQMDSSCYNISLFHFKNYSTVSNTCTAYKQSIFGGSLEFVPNAYRSPTELSCLRQMYCPDCEQRLHVDTISYDRLLYCCLPIFPFKFLYKRAIERRQSGNKVICKKCGGNLGYWKQK
ncbi:uncharacterized protein LOC101463017 [Ceratitis capitata]|uniref:uncharacterized protein LOC101463017 n=1 Tax=Ceratitis capitata TaxID=7213 RepID=UPI000329F439|nr:uncharacterized protein LOC101463017 [Ceratitis capitata]